MLLERFRSIVRELSVHCLEFQSILTANRGSGLPVRKKIAIRSATIGYPVNWREAGKSSGGKTDAMNWRENQW